MKSKEKPKYNLFQNLKYLLLTCWKVTRGLLITTLAIALFQLMNNLVGLYIAPIILQKVEQTVALGGGYAGLFEVQSRYYREGGNEDEAE